MFTQVVSADWKSDLKERLDKIVDKSGLKKADLGIAVSDGQKNILFEINGDKHFIRP